MVEIPVVTRLVVFDGDGLFQVEKRVDHMEQEGGVARGRGVPAINGIFKGCFRKGDHPVDFPQVSLEKLGHRLFVLHRPVEADAGKHGTTVQYIAHHKVTVVFKQDAFGVSNMGLLKCDHDGLGGEVQVLVRMENLQPCEPFPSGIGDAGAEELHEDIAFAYGVMDQ